MGKQGKGEQKSNLGQTGSGTDSETPAGTTGRQGNSGTENWQQGNTDTNRTGSRPNRQDDDEDSAFGNRTTLR